MTIKHAVRKRSWYSEKSYTGQYRMMDVKVSFLKTADKADSVVFSINAFCANQLDACFRAFCVENGVLSNSVLDVEIVHVA